MSVQLATSFQTCPPNAPEEEMDLGEWMKVADAARYKKRSTKTIYDWIEAGVFPDGKPCHSRQNPRTGLKEVYIPEEHLLDMEPDKDDQIAELVKRVCDLSETVVTQSKELVDAKVALHEKSTALVALNNELSGAHQAIKNQKRDVGINPLKALLRNILAV